MWWRHIGWWLIHITWPLYVLPLYKFHQIDFSIRYDYMWLTQWSHDRKLKDLWGHPTIFVTQPVNQLKLFRSEQSAACWTAKLLNSVRIDSKLVGVTSYDFESPQAQLNNLTAQQAADCSDRKGLSGSTSSVTEIVLFGSFQIPINVRSCWQPYQIHFSVTCIYFVYTFIYDIFYLPVSSDIFWEF